MTSGIIEEYKRLRLCDRADVERMKCLTIIAQHDSWRRRDAASAALSSTCRAIAAMAEAVLGE